jgi:hypothetical protein
MPIKLRTTAEPFEDGFHNAIDKVERALIAHRLDPSSFAILKRPSALAQTRDYGPAFHDYIVSIGGRHFIITLSSDRRFLEYFYEGCLAPAEKSPSPEQKLSRIMARLVHWMDQPVFNER